jgi:hypothetical protein
VRQLQDVVRRFNPRPVSYQSKPRFYREDGTFNGGRFAKAFWGMASPAYNGAEFPLWDSQAAADLTPVSASALVMRNITYHMAWVASEDVRELTSMDFVEGCARLLVELGAQHAEAFPEED